MLCELHMRSLTNVTLVGATLVKDFMGSQSIVMTHCENLSHGCVSFPGSMQNRVVQQKIHSTKSAVGGREFSPFHLNVGPSIK